MKKWLIFLFVVAVIAIGGYFLFDRLRVQRVEQTLANLETIIVERGDLVATVGGTGSVRSTQSATIVWQTSGDVEKVNVEVGDLVKTEKVLASLKASTLPQNVILAQADLANAQKAEEELYETELSLVQAVEVIVKAEGVVKKAQDQLDNLGKSARKGDIDVAEATVLLAKIKLDRAWDDFKPYENKPDNNTIRAALFNKYAQAKQTYDQAVSRRNNLEGNPSDLTYRLAEANLALAKATLADAQRKQAELQTGPDVRDVAAIQARIAAAQATIDSARLVAPFSGHITEVHNKPGDQVSPGTLAFRLDDLSSLLIDVPISEVDIGRVQIGQDAILTFDAIPVKEYHGLVTEVARVGAANQGVVDFNVTILLTDGDEAVKPGMTAAVNIVVEELDQALLIPNRAVRVKDGERVVYILKGGVPQSVKIVLGLSSDVSSEVLEGDLKEGDTVVLNPPAEFELGQEPAFVRGMRGGQ